MRDCWFDVWPAVAQSVKVGCFANFDCDRLPDDDDEGQGDAECVRELVFCCFILIEDDGLQFDGQSLCAYERIQVVTSDSLMGVGSTMFSLMVYRCRRLRPLIAMVRKQTAFFLFSSHNRANVREELEKNAKERQVQTNAQAEEVGS